MKKFLLSLLALSLIFGAVYAQDDGVVTPELTASSSVTWGVDLGRAEKAPSTHGFENKTSMKLKLPLFKGDLSKGGDEEVGVEFKFDLISGLLGQYQNGASGSNTGKSATDLNIVNLDQLSARLNFFGAYFEVYNHPTFVTDYAYRDWSIVAGDYGRKSADSGLVGANSEGDITGYGLTLGYEAENLGGSEAGLNAALKFASNDDWTKSHGVVGKNQYAVGLDLGFNFGDLVYLNTGVNAMFAKAMNQDFKANDAISDTKLGGIYGDKAYLGLGFEVGSKAVEGLDVKFAMDAFPGHGYEGKGAALDFLFDATYKWVNSALFAGNSLSYPSANKEGKEGGNMDMRLGFVSKASGDTNLVEGLDFEVALHLNSLLQYRAPDTTTIPMGLYVGGGYKANLSDSMWIRPFFGLWGETNAYEDKDGKSKFGLAYRVGVTYSPLENVEIEAAWKHGGVDQERGVEGAEENVIDHLYINESSNNRLPGSGHKGRFTLGLKLIY